MGEEVQSKLSTPTKTCRIFVPPKSNIIQILDIVDFFNIYIYLYEDGLKDLNGITCHKVEILAGA